MVSVKVMSDKKMKESSKETLKEIFENSKNLRTALTEAFPHGFTSFDKARFILVLGKGTRYIEYIDIKGFKPEAIKYEGENFLIEREEESVDY